MTLGQKLKEIRKRFGLSQESLAEIMNVSRQAITKWESDEGLPDVSNLQELSKVFNVSLDELTNNDIKDILVEKTSNTEKLAGLILKFLKFMIIFIIVLPLLLIGLRVLFKNIHEHNSGRLMNASIKCNLHDETYGYEFNYYETTGEIKEAGGDAYLSNITEVEETSDAYKALDVIDNYVKNNGGTCTRTEAKPVKDK